MTLNGRSSPRLCASLIAADRALLLAADGAGLSPEVRKTAAELRDKAFAGSRAVDWVRGLTDEVGPRFVGVAGTIGGRRVGAGDPEGAGVLERPCREGDGPAWKRGVETGEVTSPLKQPLILTALGGSPADAGRAGSKRKSSSSPSLEAMDAKGRCRGQGQDHLLQQENGAGIRDARLRLSGGRAHEGRLRRGEARRGGGAHPVRSGPITTGCRTPAPSITWRTCRRSRPRRSRCRTRSFSRRVLPAGQDGPRALHADLRRRTARRSRRT